MKNKLKTLKDNIKVKFKNFPLTFGLIFILTILVTIDSTIYIFYGDEFYFLFFLILIPFWLNIENTGLKSKTKIFSLIGTALLSFVFSCLVNVVYYDASYSNVQGYLLSYLSVFTEVLILGLTYIYGSFKKQKKKNFLEYFRDTFFNLIESCLKYGVAAIGLAIIGLVICILLFDVDYGDVIVIIPQILLFGWYFVPNSILAFQDREKDTNELLRGLFVNILSILLYVSFAVIYVYMLSMIFSLSIPKNQVFAIVSLLFFVGICIWSINSTIEDNTLWNKYNKYLPYAFIPLIILQIVCLYLRISDYGLTFSRYLGIVLVLFEIIYEVFYIFKFKLENLLYVLMGLVFTTLLCPVVNMYDVCLYSQYRRLYNLYHIENKTEEDYIKIAEIYGYFSGNENPYYYNDFYYFFVNGSVYDFVPYLSTKFSDYEMVEIYQIFEDYADYYYDNRDYFGWSCSEDFGYVDVSNYSKFYAIDEQYSKDEGSYSNSSSQKILKNYDLNVIFDHFIEAGDDAGNSELSENNVYKLDDSTDFFITRLSITYDKSNHKIYYYNIEGYLLVK